MVEWRLGCCVVLIPCMCLPSTATVRGTVAFIIVIIFSSVYGVMDAVIQHVATAFRADCQTSLCPQNQKLAQTDL